MTHSGRRVKEGYAQPHEVQRLRTSGFQEGENLSELRSSVCTTLVRNPSIDFIERLIMVRTDRTADNRVGGILAWLTAFHPKADIGLILRRTTANDPKRTHNVNGMI